MVLLPISYRVDPVNLQTQDQNIPVINTPDKLRPVVLQVKTKIVPQTGCISQGAFLGDTIQKSDISAFETMSGAKLGIIAKFWSFSDVDSGNYFPLAEAQIVDDNGSTLLMNLESWDWGGDC